MDMKTYIHERWKLECNKAYISIWTYISSAFVVIVAISALKTKVNDNSGEKIY